MESLKQQVESLKQEKNKLEQERRDVEKRSKDGLKEEKRHLREDFAQRQQSEFRVLLAHFREQLAWYDLHLTFDGEDGNTLIIAHLPSEEEQLAKQAEQFAAKAKKFHALLREKLAALAAMQTQYNLTSSETKEMFLEPLTQAQRERDSAALAMETAQAAQLAIEQLIQTKKRKK